MPRDPVDRSAKRRARRRSRGRSGSAARDTHARQPIEVTYIRHDEVRARVSTIGADGDRAFVLIAGIGVASNYYENLAPGLGEMGPVHALDLPGFAGVPYPRRPMSIQRYAAVVETVIDELGLVDPVLVGHSMGTQIVAELASRRPDLSTVVLIGPVTNPRERSLPKLAFRFLESSAHEPFRVAMLALGAYLLCGFRWFSAVLPRMMRYRIEEVLPRVQAHTLLIRGEHDSLVPREWLSQMAQLLPRASTWEIEGAAHSVMYDHARGVAQLCVEHARSPFDERAVAGDGLVRDGLVRIPDEDARNRTPRVTPRLVWQVLRSRWVEFFASARNQPSEIAEAKTEHFRATVEAYGRASDAAVGEHPER